MPKIATDLAQRVQTVYPYQHHHSPRESVILGLEQYRLIGYEEIPVLADTDWGYERDGGYRLASYSSSARNADGSPRLS